MAVTPLGNTIFINQNVNMVSNKVADVQNRFDLQNLAADSENEDEENSEERIAANDFPQASPVFQHLDLKI